MDGTGAEIDSTGSAFEFNWGAIPGVQLHVIAPWRSINPSNNPIYAAAGTGPSTFGPIDMELGAKIAFIKESKRIPQIGTLTMFEIPTGKLALSSDPIPAARRNRLTAIQLISNGHPISDYSETGR